MKYNDYLNFNIQRRESFKNRLENLGLPVGCAEKNTRTELLYEIKMLQGIVICNSGNSIRYHYVSQACSLCHKGDTSHTFIISLECPKDCYYCVNQNQTQQDFPPLAVQYENLPDKHLLKSVGITGGEPLLFAEKVIGFIRYLKEKDSELYIRIYTCGDPINTAMLESLKNAGLDEIRLSVKPGENEQHTLSVISLCTQHIPHVVVEMPVFPDKEEYMRSLLIKLDAIGVSGINLLEFLFPLVNRQHYATEGYMLKHMPYSAIYNYDYPGGLPIAGSELTALRLIKYASKAKLNMGVHYCALENKFTAQIYAQNRSVMLRKWEILDESDFFIKTLRVKIAKNKELFSKLNLNKNDYSEGSDYVDIHPRFINLFSENECVVVYSIAEKQDRNLIIKEIHYETIKGAYRELPTK